jgi:CHAT domain-containing protein
MQIKLLHLLPLLLILMHVNMHAISGQISNPNKVSQEDRILAQIERYRIDGRFDKALVYADNLLNRKHNISESIIQLFLLKSEIYLDEGDVDKAGQMLEKASIIRQHLNKNLLMTDYRLALDSGILLRQLDRTIDSYRWFQKAKVLLDLTHDQNNDIAAGLYFYLGTECYEFNNCLNALQFFNKVINSLSDSSQSNEILKLNCFSYIQMIGNSLNRADVSVHAKKCCDALLSKIINPYHPSLLTCYFNMTSLHLNSQNEMWFAKEMLDKAAEILKRYYTTENKNFGVLYYYEGYYAYVEHNFEKSMDYLMNAENYLIKNPNLASYMNQIYFLIGNIYFFYRKDYNMAIQYYELSQHIKNKWLQNDIAKSHLLMGSCYMALGDIDKAFSYTVKGIQIIKEKDSQFNGNDLSYAYICLSGIYRKINKINLAFHYLLKAYKISQKYNVNNDIKSLIMRDMGQYYKNKGHYQLALKNYQEALIYCSKEFTDTSIFANPLHVDIQMERVYIETLNMKAFALYKLFEEKENDIKYLDAALKCHEISVKSLEKRIINIGNENSEFNLLEILKVSFNNAVSYAAQLYLLTGKRSYAEKAFYFAEKSKMLVILTHTLDKNAKKYAGIPDSMLNKEKLLKYEIMNLQSQLYQNEHEKLIPVMKQSEIEKLASLQFENDHIESIYKTKYKRYYELRSGIKVPNIDQIQHLLHKDQVLMEYQLLTSELIIIVISKDKLTLRLIPNKGIEIQQIFKFYKQLSENPFQNASIKDSYEEFIQISLLLFTWLIKPVQDEIKACKLIIVPHNELNLIPFELLISHKPKNDELCDFRKLEYLFRFNAVSYAYSGTLLFDKERDQTSRKGVAFFLPDNNNVSTGYDKENSELQILSGAKEEVFASRKLLGGDLYIGNQASESNFRIASSKYKIIHIASHTLINDQIPTLSSLILNAEIDSVSDGLLHNYELYQFEINAQLVVLSGCSTGFGKLQPGEGLLSLARGFFYAGARSIAYTLWPVADKAEAMLVKNFYEQFSKGKGLEEALKSAKIEYLKSADPAKAHPYYWAGFLIVGNTDPIYTRTLFPSSLITLIIFLIVCGVGFKLYIKSKS